MVVVAVRLLGRSRMSVVVVRLCGGVVVMGDDGRVVVVGVILVTMTVIGNTGLMAVVVVTLVSGRCRLAMVVVRVGLGGWMSGRVGVTMVRLVSVSGVMAVIVVRLVLVAHRDSVPQPLFAVFAAKSV